MPKKDFIKITIQDIEIAEEFFENDKHLNEFLVNIIRYYRGKTPTFKAKIVEKYFKTYKKTMDFIISAKLSGKVGGDIRAENEALKHDTLEGLPEGGLEDTLQPKSKEEIRKNKLKSKKVEFKNSLQPYLEKYGKDMLNEFYQYWTEHNEKGVKLRYQFSKNQPFNIERRLVTWNSRNKGKEALQDNSGKSNSSNPTYEAL